MRTTVVVAGVVGSVLIGSACGGTTSGDSKDGSVGVERRPHATDVCDVAPRPRWCGPPTGQPSVTDDSVEQFSPDQDFLHHLDLTLEVHGNTVVVTVLSPGKCRVPKSGGRWEPCERPFANGMRLIGRVVGAKGEEATTDGQGSATFDLDKIEPTDTVFEKHTFSVANIPINVLSPLLAKDLNLEGTPVYAAWETARMASAHTAALHSLDEMERKITTVGPPWTDERLNTFTAIAATFKSIVASKVQFTDGETTRFTKLAAKMDALVPSYNKAFAESQGKSDKTFVANAWEAMKSKLKAPSTASLVGYAIILRCSKGDIIQLEYDAQNGFGAMLRGHGAVKINNKGGFVAWAEGETNGPFVTGYEVLLSAAAKGDCDELE